MLEEQPIGDVLKVRERLALPANEPARVVTFHVQQEPVLHLVLFDGGGKAEKVEDFFQGGFGFSRHWLVEG